MADRSKWTNIKHKKTAADAKRGKIWAHLIREITVTARLGGGGADSNPHLRLAIDKVTDVSMPKNNINRTIQRGMGGLEGANYEEIRYEGYGINDTAAIVDYLAGSRTRTVAEVHHGSDKYGGNMGTSGSVAFLFDHIGQFISAPGTPEDELIDAALEAGVDDIITHDDDSLEVICSPHDFAKVKTVLEVVGFKAELAEVIMKPRAKVVFTGEDAVKIQKLLNVLENLDDVQEVFTNAVIGE